MSANQQEQFDKLYDRFNLLKSDINFYYKLKVPLQEPFNVENVQSNLENKKKTYHIAFSASGGACLLIFIILNYVMHRYDYDFSMGYIIALITGISFFGIIGLLVASNIAAATNMPGYQTLYNLKVILDEMQTYPASFFVGK